MFRTRRNRSKRKSPTVRIAVLNWSSRRVGGAENYLVAIITELQRIGHRVAFWHEVDLPTNRERIPMPGGSPAWCVAQLGADQALAALRDWRPELIYVHRLLDPKLEAQVLKMAPALLYVHGYFGTCISESKTFQFPVVTPCDRRFGWRCLLHYYPHRCGGLSPLTMLSRFWLSARRLRMLRGYRAIVTASDHMKSEYARHGLDSLPIYKIPYPVVEERPLGAALTPIQGRNTANGPPAESPSQTVWRLLFLGRMERLKGGRVFLDALPHVQAQLARPLRVTFAGDGREREAWQRAAGAVQSRHPAISIAFVGWINEHQRNSLFANADLLVVPSLWPEPFGLVGPEAGLHGVPAAAFAVGGIPDWLVDGVNGHLAPADPPTASGLAEAIVKCLRDLEVYARLKQGAVRGAHRFSLQKHLTLLLSVFEEVRKRQSGVCIRWLRA